MTTMRGLFSVKCLPVLVLLAAAGSANAAMRCGTELIAPGDSVLKLLNACGEPAYGDPALYFGTTDWTYNFGPDQFMQQVHIADGKVVRIQQLGYGFEASPNETAPSPETVPPSETVPPTGSASPAGATPPTAPAPLTGLDLPVP